MSNNLFPNNNPSYGPELRAALSKLTLFVHSFEHSYMELGRIRNKYNHRFMNIRARQKFKRFKKEIRGFNDALRDVIEKSGNMTFDELINFLATTYTAAHGKSPSSFISHARDTIIGARNEVAFEQILTTAGITFNEGTDEDDARGGDVLVENVRIDTKTSWRKTEKAKAHALAHGYNPDRVVWSHINQDDYEGRLTLPAYKLQELAAKVRPDIERAVASVRPGHKLA